jgi:hypothetical protein
MKVVEAKTFAVVPSPSYRSAMAWFGGGFGGWWER